MFDAAGPQTVEIFYITGSTSGVLNVNGADQTGLIVSGNTVGLTIPNTILKTISIIQDFSSNYCYLMGIKVGGVLLVDETYAGANHVEYQTKGGQGDIVSVDVDNNQITLTDTGDRDNRWIADNQAGTDFAVAGPSIVDEPLLTTDVELQSSEFSTTPIGVDGLREIIWNLNGVDQPGTTLNPYKPTGLATGTTYTVKVKHVAQQLDPSEWSTSTTFTTGASRSLKDHYVRQIRELQKAIDAAQETIDDD
jgi:antitoxin component of MazEF toxin-antitoxin module